MTSGFLQLESTLGIINEGMCVCGLSKTMQQKNVRFSDCGKCCLGCLLMTFVFVPMSQ
jgi:hypothetical protein